MDNKQPSIVKSENETTNTTFRKSPEKTPSSAASPFHAMFENSAAPLDCHEGEGRDLTIEEIVELGDDSLGLKVLLTAKQGPCLGVINLILTTCNKITLEKVSNPNTGKKLLGLRTFFFRDVVNIKVLGEDQEARQRLLKVSMICREMVISVGFTGLRLGRSGTLVWVTVATSTMVFHFDVAKIGSAEAMKGGLGAVLQDGTVVKVIHDCRAVEDLLHHQLNLNLNNVFDTQAAEIYLHILSNKGALPLLVPTLPSLLSKYLELSPHHLSPTGTEHLQMDESVWLERPLSEPLGEHLARKVMFLRELRLEQLDMILVDLKQITEVYLGVLRDKDSLTVSQLEPHVVPAEVQRLGKHSSVNVVEHGILFTQHAKGSPKTRSWRK